MAHECPEVLNSQANNLRADITEFCKPFESQVALVERQPALFVHPTFNAGAQPEGRAMNSVQEINQECRVCFHKLSEVTSRLSLGVSLRLISSQLAGLFQAVHVLNSATFSPEFTTACQVLARRVGAPVCASA
jgi:hypothetical protein